MNRDEGGCPRIVLSRTDCLPPPPGQRVILRADPQVGQLGAARPAAVVHAQRLAYVVVPGLAVAVNDLRYRDDRRPPAF